ncbi:MAG: non-canonical purine NTP pyrophosphatase [Candidatus Shapirobacteria bacterium]|jgi:non-canonical purine NTP pyrophosphatase (RdgB/HAM1 family)
MKIYYITGNEEKFRETKLIIPEIEQLKIDLPEIQEIDSKKIIEAKIEEAKKQGATRFFVDDASLSLEAINGLPGPLIKWFMKTIGNEGLYEIADRFKNYRAAAKLVIGYCDLRGEIHYFEGEVRGKIVSPRGDTRFAWDRIFMPDGFEKTFSEMTVEEKNQISHRRIALNKLKEYTDSEKQE